MYGGQTHANRVGVRCTAERTNIHVGEKQCQLHQLPTTQAGSSDGDAAIEAICGCGERLGYQVFG